MSYFHNVAYVLKESDYLNIKETLDSESLEFLSFANRSQTVSALINDKISGGLVEDKVILLYWMQVNHWGEGRTKILAQKFKEVLHDHVIIGEDVGDLDLCFDLGTCILFVNSDIGFSIPEEEEK